VFIVRGNQDQLPEATMEQAAVVHPKIFTRTHHDISCQA
jgi:hypothetical protein